MKPLSIHNPMRATAEAVRRRGWLGLAPDRESRRISTKMAVFMAQYQGARALLPLMPKKRYWIADSE